MPGWQDAPVVQPAGGKRPAWEAAPVVSAPAQAKEPGFVDSLKEGATNLVKGLSSGVADIGDTILSGMAASAKPGAAIPAVSLPLALVDAVTGHAITGGDKERSESLEQFNKDNKDSTAFTVGRVAGNVLGTSGTGALLGTAAKGAGAAPAVVEALTTGGLKAGGMAGAKGLALRAAGGAANGAASTALVTGDAGEAAKGGAIGAALPVVVKGVGTVAERAGAASAGKQAADAQKLQIARAGAGQGYVIPPVDAPNPGLVTQAVSGLSGKIKTAQVASQRNQPVTDKLARKALGLDDVAELTPDTLNSVRLRAAEAYAPVRSAGTVAADDALNQRLNQIAAVSQGAKRSFPGAKDNGVQELVDSVRVPQFDAGDAVDMITNLRSQADDAFRKGDTTLGRAAKGIASALEDQLERHLQAAGSPEAVKAFQDARKLIAKSYTVQKALNPATGSVSAPVLAKELQRGKPLSDELRQVAEFSQAFPKATQALKEAPGQISPLDWLFAGGAGFGAGSSPIGAAALAARPLARSALLSRPVQERILREAVPNEAFQLFMDRALPLTGRALPVLSADRG